MSHLLQRMAWLVAATAAALAVPLSGIGDVATGCAAGAATVLIGAALNLCRHQLAHGTRLIAGGLILAALAIAAATVGSGAPWMIAVSILGGSIVIAAGLARQQAWIASQQTELEGLRSRLVRREGDVRAQADRIRQLDMHDASTGVLNRRGFALAAGSALARCASQRDPAALILIELRDPLAVNASGGGAVHAASLAHAVNQAVRGSDLLGRWDDRTLAALLPRCCETGPALQRLSLSLSERIGDAWHCSCVEVAADGPWPDLEGLIAAAQTKLPVNR